MYTGIHEYVNRFSEHQIIRRGLKIILKKVFLFFNEKVHCDPSLEPFWRDNFYGGSQYLIHGKIWKNYV